MAEQSGRQPFRFRIPWVMSTAPPAPRPPTQPQPTAPRPTTQPQSTTPTTSARPPFRPPGVAPPRPSSQPQLPPRIESRPPSPTRAASQPPSPTKTVPSQSQAPLKADSQPPSPMQTASQSRVTSHPSPSKTASAHLQAPAKSDSQAPSPTRPADQTGVASQPPSPSSTTLSQPQTSARTVSPPPSPILATPVPIHTTNKPQQPTQTTSQTLSPALATTQPQRASQSPSPLPIPSQLTTKPFSQPPSPYRQASQPTSQAPMQPQSPPKSSASQTEQSSMKTPPTQSEISKSAPQTLQEGESLSQGTYQPDLKTKPTSGSPGVPNGPSQHPASETKPDELEEENPKFKPQEENKKSTIPIEHEKKQRTIPELLHRALGSSIQPNGQLGTSQKVQQKQKQQAPVHEKDMLGKIATGNEREHVIPTPQDDKHGSAASGSQGEGSTHNRDFRDDISRFARKMSVDQPQMTLDEKPVSVITLAGENTGATIHLGSESDKKVSSVHIHRGYKLNQEDLSEATTDGENSTNRRFKDPKPREDTARPIYINSNTQGVNNSIMQNSSHNERDPGVHVVFTHYSNEDMKSNRNTESVETRKANFNITQSQKLTYEPTVKRRCLRGLFLESSDSDQDNPDKPRRHGCRYNCKEKQKEGENGIDR